MVVWLLTVMNPLFGDTGRLISDYEDMSAYYIHAEWVTTHDVPVSEYPQIPTYLLGLNRFITGIFNTSIQFAVFYAITVLEMITALFVTVKLLYEKFPSERKYRGLLMLTPPILYFIVNRFDILPALLCILALNMAQEKKWVPASILLAAATFTKWYPILILPGFFIYACLQERKFQWKMIVSFTLTSLVILLPTYMMGGMEAVLFPYQFHAGRGLEFVSLPVIINNLLAALFTTSLSQQVFILVFLALQISSPVFLLFHRPDTIEKLTHYCILSIAIFIIFARVNSPQWIIWLMPFLIISIKNKVDIWVIIVYSIVTYLFFPLCFDACGFTSVQLKILGIATYLILAIIIIRSIKGMGIQIKKGMAE